MLAHLTYSYGSGRIAAAVRANARAAARRRNADRMAAFALVIESCHPGNLGELPPSPRVLASKAYMLGLGSVREIAE